MDQLTVVLISGIASGAVYGLIGLSMVIIYRATDVFNFATASIGIFAVYLATTFMGLGIGLLIASVLGVTVVALGGILVRETIIRPLGSGQLFGALVVTMGLSLILESVAGSVWGQQPRSFPPLIAGSIRIGNAGLDLQQLLNIAIAGIAMVLVSLLFTRTHIGTAMRASAESASAADIIGIKSGRVARIAWAIGCLLAGVAAVLYASRGGLTPTVLTAALFRAMAGIFLGGLTSMSGAVIGGLVIGVLDNVAASYVSASFRDTFVFGIVIVMLLIRPQGLFGQRSFQRV
ncbi:branched-chain amino acid ABC transporter permease [Cryobacterium sp. TMS1-20-1]|uniref:branched-chain amino acid ABC transporter permease n=1 Tax=Cryobacterium sp. TMS1-20-1 TaxID=1259223 RepID=UPI00106981D4|nr:branched-chain amino acid ABC transporter permease [Cryobacterium sp. TMS1-20-1]TFC74885.1 branched-chain amino acid ABC transporter permease [Cryobacterium sp. TMS1-20-1]